jgi:carbamoyl-phosphate synthase large subunit
LETLIAENIYVLEVNPRASRTAPFVSKATGYPLAKIAALCMAGISLKEQGITEERIPNYFSVKEAVFPFVKFPSVDPLLGPEMKSTGEVMGVGKTFGEAFAKF